MRIRTGNILIRRPWLVGIAWAAILGVLVITAPRPGRNPSEVGDFLPADAPSRQAVAALGAPSGQKDRVQGWQKTDACRNYGLYSIAARYNENDIIEELELILARPLEPWIAESDLRLDLQQRTAADE